MPATSPPAILTIAGSDPSGGAGIQADLKTFTVLGVYGCAAITCLTAQNTLGVASYLPVTPSFVEKQIRLVLEDIQPSHIKIGMVGTSEIAVAIGNALAGFQGEIIYDPVLRASSGKKLFNTEDLVLLCDHVISRATVLTPNILELQGLSMQPCSSMESIEDASQSLLEKFPNLKALVAKGGHFQEESASITDVLFMRGPDNRAVIHQATHPRVMTENSHGTGCTFAAAFAAYHLQSAQYKSAFFKTVAFLDELLTGSAPLKMGGGKGPLLHHLHCRSAKN